MGEPEHAAEGHARDYWSGRLAFILAAVGSAVGFGNVWRFPSLAYQYGGGAFFIPYLLALFLLGIPILVLEICLGQYFQSGDPGAFGAIHPRFVSVGVSSIVCCFFFLMYYAVLIAWTTTAFFDTFGGNYIWDEVNGEEGFSYFINDVVGQKTLGDDGKPTRLVWANVGTLAIVWFVAFLCIVFGIANTGRITYFTMGLPIVLLFVFLGKAVSLDGSGDGIEAYIGKWDMAVLSEQPDCWSTAASQIFFSISICFGIMTAYGSHCERSAPAFNNSVIIAISNSMFSFLSGFAVFAAVGALAKDEGKSIDDLKVSGFGLVFGSYAVVLASFAGGKHWVRLLFFDLFLLGIDSAFSGVEAVVTVILDTKYFANTALWKVTAFVCLTLFLCGAVFVTDAGLSFLDVVDFYINFILLIVGFFETFAAGWVYGLTEQVEKYGPVPVYLHMATSIVTPIIASGLWFGIDNGDAALSSGFCAYFVLYVAGTAGVAFCLKDVVAAKPETFPSLQSAMHGIYFENVFELRDRFTDMMGYVPYIWAILIKHFCCPILLILFANLAASEHEGKPQFGNYLGLDAWPYQVIGIGSFVTVVVAGLIGVFLPNVYSGFLDAVHRAELVIEEHNKSMRQSKGLDKPEDDEEDDSPKKELDDGE